MFLDVISYCFPCTVAPCSLWFHVLMKSQWENTVQELTQTAKRQCLCPDEDFHGFTLVYLKSLYKLCIRGRFLAVRYKHFCVYTYQPHSKEDVNSVAYVCSHKNAHNISMIKESWSEKLIP